VTSRQKRWLDQVGSVLESLNQGVIISDEDRRIICANSMFLEMGKMSADDILGRSVMDLYPADEGGRLQEFIARRRTEGRLNMNSTFRNPTAGACRLRLRPASCMASMDALTELLRRRTSATRNGPSGIRPHQCSFAGAPAANGARASAC
jgi:PAS domain-containing protein